MITNKTNNKNIFTHFKELDESSENSMVFSCINGRKFQFNNELFSLNEIANSLYMVDMKDPKSSELNPTRINLCLTLANKIKFLHDKSNENLQKQSFVTKICVSFIRLFSKFDENKLNSYINDLKTKKTEVENSINELKQEIEDLKLKQKHLSNCSKCWRELQN